MVHKITKKQVLKLEIVENIPLIPSYYRITFQSPLLAQTMKPGQFVMITPNEATTDPFLSIPLALFDFTNDTVSALYHVVGNGTQYLQHIQTGKKLFVLAPLGNGFDMQLTESNTPIQILLVAGGCGLAPLFPVAKLFSQLKHRVFVYLGVHSQSDLFYLNELKELGVTTFVATMDGSAGYRGIVTDLLLSHVKQLPINMMLFLLPAQILCYLHWQNWQNN